jgi:C4-dicarboxylate-specific signal transduction histidine kinase
MNAEQALAGRAGGRIEARVEERDGRAVVTVDDNGRGLAALAEPPPADGDTLGIGLAVARSIAERSEGELTLAARADGQGCVATLSLPIALP